MDEPLKHYIKSKKPDTKGHILHNLHKILRTGNWWRQKVDQWLPGDGESKKGNDY